MIAIVFQPHASAPLGLIGSLLVLGVGASGLLTWAFSVTPSRVKVRHVWVGVAVAATLMLLTLRVVTGQTICFPCMNCDPWWLEYFWICI